MKLLTGLAVLVGATLALSACGGSHAVVITDHNPGLTVTPYAYAYLVPADPAHPGRGGWGTLVRWHPINVGDRIPLSVLTTSASDDEASVWKGRCRTANAARRYPRRDSRLASQEESDLARKTRLTPCRLRPGRSGVIRNACATGALSPDRTSDRLPAVSLVCGAFSVRLRSVSCSPDAAAADRITRWDCAAVRTLGLACDRVAVHRCERVGLAVWLARPASGVTAVADGISVRLRTHSGGTGRYRRRLYWQGFFHDPRAQTLADSSRSVPLRVRVTAPDGSVSAGTRTVFVSEGYG